MSLKERKHLKKVKKENARKKVKLSNGSDCEDESEHELYYYANDRVKLMKEILKTLKTRKIKSLTPDSLKNFDMEEIKTMLLEELLGISNKRLKKIFEGQNTDDESSSTDEEQADVISLDEISDEEYFCFVDESPNEKKKMDPKNDKSKNSRRRKIKTELKVEGSSKVAECENEKLLSVLELLELQARARAIRSQLAIEAESKSKAAAKATDSDDSDVIVESPKVNEIVISSSESEPENSRSKSEDTDKSKRKKGQKVKIVRERRNVELVVNEKDDATPQSIVVSVQKTTTSASNIDTHGDVSEDVINLDVVEIEGIDD